MAEAGAARGALQWRQPLNGALGRKWRGEQAEKKGRTLLGRGSLRSRGSVIPARLGSGVCATDLRLWLPKVPSPPQKPWAAKGSGKVFGGFSVFFSSRTPPPHAHTSDRSGPTAPPPCSWGHRVSPPLGGSTGSRGSSQLLPDPSGSGSGGKGGGHGADLFGGLTPWLLPRQASFSSVSALVLSSLHPSIEGRLLGYRRTLSTGAVDTAAVAEQSRQALHHQTTRSAGLGVLDIKQARKTGRTLRMMARASQETREPARNMGVGGMALIEIGSERGRVGGLQGICRPEQGCLAELWASATCGSRCLDCTFFVRRLWLCSSIPG